MAFPRHNRNDKQVTVVYEMRRGEANFNLVARKNARKIEGQLNGKSDERWLICDRKRKIERKNAYRPTFLSYSEHSHNWAMRCSIASNYEVPIHWYLTIPRGSFPFH